MANSMKTGITVTPTLLQRFADASTGGGDRFIKAVIKDDEVLDFVLAEGPVGDWEADFDQVPPHLPEKDACYVLFRTDKQNSEGRYLWYMLCYVNDYAKVRAKMLYASTRHTLRTALGQYNFIDEIHGTEAKDFNTAGFKAYYIAKTSEAPLTESERIKKEELEASYNDYVVGDAGALPTPGATRGVSFPVDPQVLQSLEGIKAGTVNYIRLVIDVENEVIKVDHAAKLSPNQVGEQVPKTDCAFHFFNWSHMHQGNHVDSLIFAFSCPDGSGGSKSAPVRSRMLYAASKNNVAALAAQRGLELALKMEIANAGDFAENEYAQQIHPVEVVAQAAFKKPAAPGRKGKK